MLWFIDALITLEQVGGTGGDGGKDRGRITEAVRHWFSRKDDQVQGRLIEERVIGRTTTPLPLIGRVLRKSAYVQGKGLDGG